MFTKQLITRGASSSIGEGTDVPENVPWDNLSMQINGTDEYFVCCNEGLQSKLIASGGSRKFKIHLWFYRTASRNTSNDAQTLWNNGATDANNILSFYIDDSDTEIKYKAGTGSDVTTRATGLNITNDTWHHLNVRIYSGAISVILDGNYDGKDLVNATRDYSDSPAFQYIGADLNTGTARNFFPGRIAHYDVLTGTFASGGSYYTNLAYNDGELIDTVNVFGNSCQSWLKFGDGRGFGHRDGDDDKVILDLADGVYETDLMEGNGLAPGTTHTAWSKGGNWAVDSSNLNSPADADGAVDDLVYNTTGDFEITVGWIYRLLVLSQTIADPGGDSSYISFAGNTLVSAAGWPIVNGVFDNYFIASNTNDFTYRSHGDGDSAANSYLYYAIIYKPSQIAYAVGLDMSRGSGIIKDGPNN
jgi:hypothetical protein